MANLLNEGWQLFFCSSNSLVFTVACQEGTQRGRGEDEKNQ